ncbi:hypothetical protein SFRURICE_010338 [Spodoptera frugiperda]|nr:hypothetical protein SFRURICE_010338 [Spodoptera frugiperda]
MLPTILLCACFRMLFHKRRAMLRCCGYVWLPPIIFIGTYSLALVETDSAKLCFYMKKCVLWMASLPSTHRMLGLRIYFAQLHSLMKRKRYLSNPGVMMTRAADNLKSYRDSGLKCEPHPRRKESFEDPGPIKK